MMAPNWAAYLGWRAEFGRAMDARCYTVGHLDNEILSGRARFWDSETAAIVATIKVYPAGARAVHGLVAAGELAGIKRLILLAEQWGRDGGCIFGEIESAPAWSRIMRDEGYRPVQLLLQKELADGI